MPHAVVAQSSDRFSSMLAFFFVGLLVVTPYAVVRVRRVLRDRSARAEPAPDRRGVSADDPPPVAPGSPDDLAVAVAAIAAGAATGRPFEVRVPRHPRHEGRAVPDQVAGGILADALRRGGVTVTGRRTTHDAEWWSCVGPQ